MYENIDKISFGDLKTELKALIWPNGVPENLVAPIDKSFEDAFIDLQRYVSCLQGWHTDVFAQCATYFKCGLTVLDKPRGKIRRIRTFQGDFCDPVTLIPATIQEVYCWSRRFMERIDAPENVGLPELPMGFHYADASTDSQFGRALVGLYAFDRERIYIAPWIQSLESVVVEWDGLKRKFADTDLFPDEQDFKRALRLYVQTEFSRDFERDFTSKQQFKADYQDARADLIYDCEQENRLPKAEPCKTEREYLWDHRLEDDSPDTGSHATVTALLGDYGSNDDNERAVATLIKSWAPSAIFTLGDNGSETGVPDYDAQVGAYFRSFMHEFAGSAPLWAGEQDPTANKFWPALGEHDNDYLSTYQGYFEDLSLPGNGRYYDKVIGPCHFFVLNSGEKSDGTLIESAGNTITSMQAAWLRGRVAQSTAKWKIAIVHFPPYSSGPSAPGNLALRWDFRAMGINMVISGHDHHYERLTEDGVTYLVAGSGGQSLESFGGAQAGSEVRYDSEHGAIRLAATCECLLADFIGVNGAVIDSVAIGQCTTEAEMESGGTGGGSGGESGGGVSPSDGSGCCPLRGTVEPEGAVTASPPQIYILDDGVNYQVWIKRTGYRTNTGWYRALQLE